MIHFTYKGRLTGPEPRFDILRDVMFSATKVYNGLVWNLREEYEQNSKVSYSASHLNEIARSLSRHKELYSDVVDTTRMEVGWSFQSFFAKGKNDPSSGLPSQVMPFSPTI